MKNIISIILTGCLLFSCNEKKEVSNLKTITIQNETANLKGKIDLEKEKTFHLNQNGVFVDTILSDEQLQDFTIQTGNLVIWGYLSNASKVRFFENAAGKLDYEFDKEDHLNNFSKIFHDKLMPPLMNNKLTKENFAGIKKEVTDYYKKIKGHLNETEQKVAQYMMQGRFTTVMMMFGRRNGKAPNDDYYKFVDKSNFPKDFFKYYSDNYSVAMGMFMFHLYRKGLNPQNLSTEKLIEEIALYSDNQDFRDTFMERFSTQAIEKGDEKNKAHLLKLAKEKGISEKGYAKMKAITADKKEAQKGDKALYFETLKPLMNSSVNTLKGKVVYVDNWATWCAPCINNIKGFIKNKVNFPKGVVMAFVSHDYVEAAAVKFINKTAFPKKQIIYFYNKDGRKGKYAAYYNLKGLPRYFVIGKDGILLDMNPVHPSEKGFEKYLLTISKK